MTVWRYRFADLLFESALSVPEWNAFRPSAIESDPDVRIILDNTGERPVAEERPVVGRDEFRLSVSNVGRYQVLGGSRIVVAPVPGIDPAELRLWLLGSVLAALCCQRGVLLLHASVVRLKQRTIALCGATGSGKSSLAAALIGRGAAFVCDDLGRFDSAGGRPVAYPSTPRLKLSPDAVRALGWSTEGLARVHARARKFHVPQVLVDPWSPVPLDAICLLDWADGPVGLTTLAGTPALRAVVAAATYRPALLEPMGRLTAHWQQCADLVAGAVVSRLTRPHAWEDLDAAADAIEKLAEAVDRCGRIA